MTVLNSSSRNACLPPTPFPMPHIPPSVAEEPATAVRNRQGRHCYTRQLPTLSISYQTSSFKSTFVLCLLGWLFLHLSGLFAWTGPSCLSHQQLHLLPRAFCLSQPWFTVVQMAPAVPRDVCHSYPLSCPFSMRWGGWLNQTCLQFNRGQDEDNSWLLF